MLDDFAARPDAFPNENQDEVVDVETKQWSRLSFCSLWPTNAVVDVFWCKYQSLFAIFTIELDLIREAKLAKMYTATSTNAHFIDKAKALEIIDSGLDRLIISVDGITQATYEQYRVNGSLSKVLEASAFLVEAKKERRSATPFLIFQFLAVKPNEAEIPAVFTLAKEIGIDEVRIKTAQLYDFKNGNSLMPEQEEYARYAKQSDGTYKLKGRQGNHCWRMWSGSVLTWDGKVVPCCFDKDASHVLGNVTDQHFRGIWKSKEYQKFRYAVLVNRQEIDICKNCSEGTKVWS